MTKRQTVKDRTRSKLQAVKMSGKMAALLGAVLDEPPNYRAVSDLGWVSSGNARRRLRIQ